MGRVAAIDRHRLTSDYLREIRTTWYCQHFHSRGAVITTEPHDTASRLSKSATTPDAWALADARSFASEIPPIEPFLLPSESGAAHAVICSYDEVVFSSDQHIHHSVAIFWEFDHQLFAAHLNYNANDPHGPIFEKVFLQTVRNVRPLQKHSP